MPAKKPSQGNPPVRGRDEEMFVSSDERSLQRGRRVAPRTASCRPCLFWSEDETEKRFQGVLLDLNPYGMRVRSLDTFGPGTLVQVQMMRDEQFTIPLSPPIKARVVRVVEVENGFYDLGLKVQLEQIKRVEGMRPVAIRRPSVTLSSPVRMHTAEFTRGENPRRMGRNRG